MKIKKCIIPAAGLGTRFLPATKALPKEMLPIIDKPAIQYIVEEAVAAGIEEILIITGRGKRAIEDHFDRSYELENELLKKENYQLHQEIKSISNMANIYYIRQKEALGLGDAIYKGKSFIGNEPFAILLGDDIVKSEVPCIKQLMDHYDTHQSPIIGIQQVCNNDISNYGVIDGKNFGSSLHTIHTLVEKPCLAEAPSNLAIMGRYIVTADIFPILESLPPGRGNEIQLTDAFSKLGEKRRLLGYEFSGERYDIGSKFGYMKATIDFALERNDLHDELLDYLKTITEAEKCLRSVC